MTMPQVTKLPSTKNQTQRHSKSHAPKLRIEFVVAVAIPGCTQIQCSLGSHGTLQRPWCCGLWHDAGACKSLGSCQVPVACFDMHWSNMVFLWIFMSILKTASTYYIIGTQLESPCQHITPTHWQDHNITESCKSMSIERSIWSLHISFYGLLKFLSKTHFFHFFFSLPSLLNPTSGFSTKVSPAPAVSTTFGTWIQRQQPRDGRIRGQVFCRSPEAWQVCD